MSSRSNPEKVMPVMEHIRELRNCILVSMAALAVGFVVSFVFSDRIIALFTRQFETVASAVEKKLVVQSIVEGFTTQMKISAIGAFILSLPVHVFNLLRFTFPGLTRRQRRIIIVLLAASLILIVFGAYLGYFSIVPMAIRFLTDPLFVPAGVGYILGYGTNVFFVLTFIIWSLIALQTPLVLEVLLMMNVLKRKAVFRSSRYIIVGIFILAAVITPSPDFISQLGIAIPMVFLYFVALLVAKVFKFGEG